MQRRTRSLEDCLKADTGLARLTGHATRLLRLQRLFEMTTPLARGARVANLRSGKIVLHAANGAIAAKLKQITPTLADVFRSEAPEVTGIEIRVQPPQGRGSSPKPGRIAAATIGEAPKRRLASFADRLPEESPLRSSILRMIRKS